MGFRCARALIALRSRSSIVEGFWPISYRVVIFVFWRSTKQQSQRDRCKSRCQSLIVVGISMAVSYCGSLNVFVNGASLFAWHWSHLWLQVVLAMLMGLCHGCLVDNAFFFAVEFEKILLNMAKLQLLLRVLFHLTDPKLPQKLQNLKVPKWALK